MKKIKYILFLIIIFTLNVDAKVLTEELFEESYNLERAYIVGNYVFDIGNGFNPTLEDLLIAASYSKSTDVKVYEIKISTNVNNEVVKEYTELLSNTKLSQFPVVDVKYIYSGSIKDDKASYKIIDETMALTYGKSLAKELTKDEYMDLNIERAYVIGDYMFDLSNGFNPSLKDLLIASTTMFSNKVKVYELKNSENITGNIVEEYDELISSNKLDSYPLIGVKYIYNKHIDGNPTKTLPYYDLVTFSNVIKTYTGSSIVVDSAVSEHNFPISYEFYNNIDCSGEKLVSGAIDVGEYGVLAKSNGNEQYLSNSACAKLTVTRLDASDSNVSFVTTNNVYTGKEIKPDFTVVKNGITLTKDRDYEYSYSDNINAGNGKVTILYKGNYKGSQDVSFTISKLAIKLYSSNDTKVYDDALLEKSSVGYCNLSSDSHLGDGDTITACNVKSTSSDAGIQDLIIDSYVISKNGVNVNENYDVTLQAGKVNIAKRATLCNMNPLNKVYDGTKLNTNLVCDNLIETHKESTTKTIPNIINVADSTIFSLEKTEVKIVKENVDKTNNYDITIANGGEIPLVIKAKRGNNNSRIIVDYEYDHVTGDGTPKTPRVLRIHDEELNVDLLENESYTYSYFNNINIGTGEIRITFKGNYQGEKTVTFAIE